MVKFTKDIYKLIAAIIMDNFINKKELSEEDIKNRYITPALNDSGWKNDEFRMELRIKQKFKQMIKFSK